MIVDLLRNDLSMVCEPGTVEVPVLMEVESYQAVHQLVSTVRGRLRDGVTTVGRAARAVPGRLDDRRAQAAHDADHRRRSRRRRAGVYAGAFGWISADGRADLGVVIRSLMTDRRRPLRRSAPAAASPCSSDVAEEYAESRWKAERLLRVFDASMSADADSCACAENSAERPGHRVDDPAAVERLRVDHVDGLDQVAVLRRTR